MVPSFSDKTGSRLAGDRTIDIHKREYAVAQQSDGQAPKSPQRFKPDVFLQWVGKLSKQAVQVVTGYEAGCFGYVLHRQLEAMGIRNLVVRPRNWDEYGAKVKTDAHDARELCSHLDRYLAGNDRSLSIVRVPSEAEERARSLSRQREALAKKFRHKQHNLSFYRIWNGGLRVLTPGFLKIRLKGCAAFVPPADMNRSTCTVSGKTYADSRLCAAFRHDPFQKPDPFKKPCQYFVRLIKLSLTT